MKRTTRFSKTIYKTQSLTEPKAEYWPESAKDLIELSEEDTHFTSIGGGQHINKKSLKTDAEIIRLGKMNDILNIDKLSMLARVEAGMTWKAFKELAKERELSTDSYRLYPDAASLGGIISRRTQNRRSLWDGSLLNYCLGLRGISKLGDYRYLNAPRKSSGPDLRSFWFGAAGKHGVIADLTLGLFPIQEKLVLTATGDRDLLGLPALLENMGVRSAWSHGNIKTNKVAMDIGFSGSKERLDAIINELGRHDLSFKYDWVQGSECDTLRNKIEEEPWKARSEKFVRVTEMEKVNKATIVNTSLYGFTIQAPHRSKKSTSKWSKNLNTLTNTAGQK